ncbi:MAG: protein kinase domain-containing protein, partial [Planctomycetota bacterium]
FRRESRIIAQLNHPHIAQVYHLHEEGGQVHLVMEYVPGRSLAEMIDQDGALEIETALDLCTQIACAMESAHQRGIIHRDLKPANIRVTEDGVAKVLDFGIARIVREGDARDEAVDTANPVIVGTPGYMAPEQAEGGAVDARADVFSFGCVLHECLTGAPLLPGSTVRERLAATRSLEYDGAELPSALPDGVLRLLQRCLARYVGQRMQTMSAVRMALDAALGRRQAPTLDTPPGVVTPGNLPAPTTSFVGRTGPLKELAQLLARARFVTLTGPGGAGKTRLALELARRVSDRFPDGVFLVELAAVAGPTMVPDAVATTLGVKERAKSTTADVIGEHLATKSMLLVIDNCEHVLDAVTELATALLRGAPSLRIVATSREAMKSPGEHAWPVPGLSLPRGDVLGQSSRGEAVALFEDRSRAVRPAFRTTDSNAAAVVRICRRLDGIPLAIELAAAQARVLTPEEIDARLDDRLRLLALESPGMPERHRTLRAAIDWSYRDLADGEKRMFRILSVFAGGWSLEAAATVCGPGGALDGGDLDELGVIDLLTHLVDKSLVIAHDVGGESRYRMLETVRQYAAELLEQARENDMARRRHLDFHLSLADRVEAQLTGGDQATVLAHLESEHENLLAALANSASLEGGAEKALRLCGSMRQFWRLHGHFKTGCEACSAALAHPGAGEPTSARAMALQAAAGMALSLGDYEAASAFAGEALDIERGIDELDGVARALNTLGNAAYYR